MVKSLKKRVRKVIRQIFVAGNFYFLINSKNSYVLGLPSIKNFNYSNIDNLRKEAVKIPNNSIVIGLQNTNLYFVKILYATKILFVPREFLVDKVKKV